jgi:hypothetical protein
MNVNYFFLCITLLFGSISIQAQHIELDELEINDDSYTTIIWGTVKKKKQVKRNSD